MRFLDDSLCCLARLVEQSIERQLKSDFRGQHSKSLNSVLQSHAKNEDQLIFTWSIKKRATTRYQSPNVVWKRTRVLSCKFDWSLGCFGATGWEARETTTGWAAITFIPAQKINSLPGSFVFPVALRWNKWIEQTGCFDNICFRFITALIL